MCSGTAGIGALSKAVCVCLFVVFPDFVSHRKGESCRVRWSVRALLTERTPDLTPDSGSNQIRQLSSLTEKS